jgi:exopolyphosphatase/pppGpp-phosphohydrolase
VNAAELAIHIESARQSNVTREVNAWFRQTQTMHKATLELKLHAVSLGKLQLHTSAMHYHTTKQIRSAVVSVPLFSREPNTFVYSSFPIALQHAVG